MAIKEYNTSFYRYILSSFTVMIPNEESIEILQSNINSMSIEKDFDNDFFPILYFNIRLSPDIYYKIMENKTRVRFKVRMDKYLYEENNTNKFKQLVFNEIFIMFPDNNNVFMDKDLYKRTQEMNSNMPQLSDFKTSYDFYLFKEKDLIASKKVTNTIINNNNMVNIVSYLLSLSNFSNVLMTPFDNNNRYNEVILLPVSLLNNINHLDNMYGFYNHGKLVFFDYNTIYFISKRAACLAYRPNEYKDVIVMCNKSSQPKSLTPGSYKDNSQRCYVLNITKDNIKMYTSSIVSNQIDGNKIISISPSTGINNNIEPNIQQIGSSSSQVIINNFDNKYTDKSLEYRKIENDNIININYLDIDIDCMTPNKRFIFRFEDTDIQKQKGGDYRLTNTVIEFAKEGMEFSVTGTAQFKKIK